MVIKYCYSLGTNVVYLDNLGKGGNLGSLNGKEGS
jgi:hypothetical protein